MPRGRLFLKDNLQEPCFMSEFLSRMVLLPPLGGRQEGTRNNVVVLQLKALALSLQLLMVCVSIVLTRMMRNSHLLLDYSLMEFASCTLLGNMLSFSCV